MKYLITVIFFICTGCSDECRNYIITSVDLERVKFAGIDSIYRSDTILGLLRFKLDYVNCKSVFMGGSIEPGINGIDGSIRNIIITDSTNTNVTNKFLGITFKGFNKIVAPASDSMSAGSYYYNKDLQSLINSINSHKNNESGRGLTFPRIFTMPKNLNWPIYIKIYFGNSDSLIKKIDFRNQEVKTYTIK